MKVNKRTFRKIINFILIASLTLQQIVLPSTGFMPAGKVEAAAKTLTSRIDFESGLQNNTEAGSREGALKIKADGSWGARSWRTPNLALGDQAAIASDGNYIYLLHNADHHFVRYLPLENRWQTLADAPHYGYVGANLVVIGDYVYATFGGYQKEFSRYSIIENTWTERAALPDLIWNGSALATDGTYIYALHGSSTQDFWRYSPESNSWSTLSNTPGTIYTGAGMVYYDGNLYATRGTNSTTLYRYNISAATWSTLTTGGAALAAVPAALNEDHTISIRDDEIFVTRDGNTSSFYKYDISANSWSTLTNTPQTTRYVGSVYNSADDYIYVFRGNSQYDFWKYDPDSNSFLGATDLPNTPGSGADLIYDNGYLYMPRGNNSQNFYRYDLATGVWAALTNTPATLNDDTKGINITGDLYLYRGGNTRTFYNYDVAGGNWTQLADTPQNVRYGGSVAYPGTGDYIYGTRGANTATFWRYDKVADTWDDASVADLPDNAEASYGARLTSDGTDIYFISGYGRTQLLKYTILTNTWSVLSTLPFAPNWGTDVVYRSGKLYIQAGFYKDDFWEYTISTNTWRAMPDIQTHYSTNLGPYNGGSLESDGSGNLYSISGQNLLRMDIFTTSTYNYPVSGVWTSAVQDLGYVDSWTSLTDSLDTPGDSSVTYEMRSSTDRTSWTNWHTVTSGVIPSGVTANRYVQIRATLNSTSDRTQTPSINSLTVNYVGDEDPPVNPSVFTGSSQAVGGVSLTSGQDYGYAQPYFGWDAGSDSKTAIAGYYVYFGPSSSANPETEGSYQTGRTYTVSTPMSTGNYYLRIKTKDTAGNISAAVTGFTYGYNGVSPALTLTQTTSSDFASGSPTDTDTSGDNIKLSGKAGFWQQERLANAPANMYNGAALAYVESTGKMYTFRGNGGLNFYEYDIATNAWTARADAPATVNYGGGVVEGPSGYLYGLRGLNTTSFWRYDIAGNAWSDGAAADAPQSLSYGASMVFDGNRYIYVLRGNSDDAFMRYDTESDSWDGMANTDFGAPGSQVNNLVYYGGSLAYDGSGLIYATQGNTRTGFSAYDKNSNSWTPLPNLPAMAYYGSQISYDGETNSIYYLVGWDKPFFYKYDIAAQTWTQLPDAPVGLAYGASMRNVDGKFYILRGANTTTFYKYDIAKSSWLIPTEGLFGGFFRGSNPMTFSYGADIVKGDSNNYYLTRGNWDNLFVRYNSETGEATKMADAPAGFYYGGSLAYDGNENKIYATFTVYTRKLFVYDIATDTWSEMASDPPPFDVNTGGDMEYDGSRYIYWVRGGNTNTFYRYDTQGSDGARWTSRANAPATMSYGADLVYKDGYIYTLRGNTQLGFYRYDVNANSWNDAAVADLPSGATVSADGFLVDGGNGYLYACRGNNQVGCYRYSIAANSWEAIENAPANITAGGAAASNGSNKIFVIAGPGTNTFADGLYTYVIESDNSSFESSGSFVSGTHDLGAVYRFAGLSVTYAEASNTTLSISTRTSDDNSTWSSWNSASEEKRVGTNYYYKISSPASRYIQVKFNLASSDNVFSGVISDYTVNYYQDLDRPNNPETAGLTGYTTATQSATITTGNWYNYPTPNFEWAAAEALNGATDGVGSGVSGYYVYFGSNSSADASVSGTLVTAPEYTASGLTSGETYYLRIKTIDDAGNFAASNWQPFVYKYDSVAPTNPVTISVDPAGYSSTNNYSFTMKGATDSASLLGAFCYKYKTGVDDGENTYSAEDCITTIDSNNVATASGVLAYDNGEDNTFYVRVRDNAGNYASNYATQIYKYSGTAPSKPTGLEVTYPVGSNSNSVNEFAFAWEAPENFSGAESGLRYYYSFNALPTGNNVNEIGLSDNYLSRSSYATQKGNNILYVVAKDEAGNIDYTNYAQITFIADTSAPGIPRNIDISDVSIKETSSWRLALSWDSPEASGSGVATYKIYRSAVEGSTCNANYADFNYVASTTQTSYVDTGLTQTEKYYCVKACDSTNECSAVSDTVSLYPDGRWRVAPELLSDPTVSVKTKSAIVTWSTTRASNSFVKFGKSSGNYGEEVGSSTQVAAHTISLTGLDPGTTYYYKVQWADEDGNIGTSEEFSFATNPAPHVSSVKFSNVNINSLYVNFTIKNAVKATLQYGKTTSYGGSETISTSTSESTYTIALSSLTEGTLYHLKISGEDSEGNTYDSDDYTFETLPTPKILNLKVQQVAGMPTATLRLLWSSNTLVSSIVTYYPTNSPEKALDQISLALKKNHEVIIKNLVDSTDYTFDIKGKDSAGNEATSVSRKIKTSQDIRAPEIQNMNVESTIVGVGESAKAQIVVSWDTDEPATTQVEYAQGTGTSYGQTTQEDSALTTNHTVTITGLTPAKIYHLRAISKDKVGNIGQSFDTVIITPKSTKDALNLVIENLSLTFGFLNNLKIGR